ncbi:carbon-phosphorus lyase complex subunit PhnI [Thiosocius teredinicola]|uniref:carbon-phosphorus lyase complex subunit PhnI n=1 Tax=Thiosocius teredinicola TaxID=1973002 RepID=UPI000990A49B
MYVAVKGGEKAIDNAHRLLASDRRGDRAIDEIGVDQIREQLSLAVDRVMIEGSVYDRDLAALALKQARGDVIEAIFLLRAYRTTLPRLAVSEPIDTDAMHVERRISATYKDIPGGQILGPTFDYTHRLLDFALAAEGDTAADSDATKSESSHPASKVDATQQAMPRVTDVLNDEDLIETEANANADEPVGDLTREPLTFPAERDIRLQNLARADEGFLLAMGYSTQRGYGRNHPFAGEIRMGEVSVEIVPEELGFAIDVGDIVITECEMINQFKGNAEQKARFTRGYGLTFGYGERKAMAMALVDRALRSRELGEDTSAPAQDEEFVLYHSDNVEASGFVQHLKLPHYVDFQGELDLVRRLRAADEHDDATQRKAGGAA